MDVDRLLSLDKAFDGNGALKVSFMMASGMNSSALEHSVPEQMFSTPDNPVEAVSAVKAIQIAAEQGIPVYTVTQANVEAIMPVLSLDADVKGAISDAVNAGMEVTVPQTNINFHGVAIAGYIALDPDTGEGAYMISGGESGAKIVEGMITACAGLFTGDWGKLANGSATLFEGLTGVYEFYTSSYFSDYLYCVAGDLGNDAIGIIVGALASITVPLGLFKAQLSKSAYNAVLKITITRLVQVLYRKGALGVVSVGTASYALIIGSVIARLYQAGEECN
jgi:hypothetical protein